MRRSASTTTATHRRVSVVTDGGVRRLGRPLAAFEAHRGYLRRSLSLAERAQVERFRAEERPRPAHGVPRVPRLLIGRYLGPTLGSSTSTGAAPSAAGPTASPG